MLIMKQPRLRFDASLRVFTILLFCAGMRRPLAGDLSFVAEVVAELGSSAEFKLRFARLKTGKQYRGYSRTRFTVDLRGERFEARLNQGV